MLSQNKNDPNNRQKAVLSGLVFLTPSPSLLKCQIFYSRIVFVMIFGVFVFVLHLQYSICRLIVYPFRPTLSDSNNRMIQLTDFFVYTLGVLGPTISDYNKRMILLSMILLSGGYSNCDDFTWMRHTISKCQNFASHTVSVVANLKNISAQILMWSLIGLLIGIT